MESSIWTFQNMTIVTFWHAKDTNVMSEIKSKLVKTKNIKNSLQSYAAQNALAVSTCDFIIKSTQTFIKTSASPDFVLFNENINEAYKEKEKLLNEQVGLHQVYIIEISAKKNAKLKLEYSIELEEHASHPKIVLLPTSIIPYKTQNAQETFVSLVKEINKIKAFNGLLINIFDNTMIDTLKKFVPHLYAGKFTKKIKMPLFEGLDPELSQESKVIKHFQNKVSTKELIEVEKDELLVEFFKPLYGKKGFNAFGQIIENGIGKNILDVDASTSESTILVQESPEKKLYLSKIKGFVTLMNNKLVVDNKIKMSKISRLNNEIAQEEKNNIEVHVAQNDTNKDSIGAGVALKSESIHVTGHIGANSLLEAIYLQVDGATHKDSFQFAKNAKINRHKGTLRCNSAKINLLEGGEVHGTTVEVEASLGGTIYAQDAIIGNVKHHLKVYASNSITIRLVSGEDNLFKINYRDIPILKSKLDLIESEVRNLQDSLQDAKKNNLSAVALLSEKIKAASSEINKIKKSTNSARISIKEPFRGLNTIIFALDSGDEIVYKTKAQSYEPFFLEIGEEKITLHPVEKSISLRP